MGYYSGPGLNAYFDQQIISMQNEIKGFSDDIILANDLDLLADNCFEKYRVFPISIGTEDTSLRKLEKIQMTILKDDWHREEGTMKVDGWRVSFFYPFSGEEVLFKYRASTFTTCGYPDFEINGGYIVVSQEIRDIHMGSAKAEKLKDGMPDTIKRILDIVEYANNDATQYNNKLRQTALDMLIKRKSIVEAVNGFAEQMNISLKKNSNAARVINLPRQLRPVRTKSQHETSYAISDGAYTDILSLLTHYCASLEQTPNDVKSLNEENLRSLLLAHLNGNFKGAAKGECFRNNGKTDILIELNNRAAFVAECKMWKGAKTVVSAVSQLDSYLTWRDCKVALIFFCRQVNFLEALTKMHEALKSIAVPGAYHKKSENEAEIKIASESNVGQYVRVYAMMFNLYSKK